MVVAPWLFGAADPWAFLLLAMVVLACGALWLLSADPRKQAHPALRDVALWGGAFALVLALQACPLPFQVLRIIAPRAAEIRAEAAEALREISGSNPGGASGFCISLCAPSTVRALYRFLACAAVFWILANSLESWQEARRIAAWLVAGGFALALFALWRRWGEGWVPGTVRTSEMPVTAFGPFANRNHYAAHVNMLLGCALGLAGAECSLVSWETVRGWRQRLRWCATPEGCRVVLLLFVSSLLALSVVVSLSRAGTASLVAALLAAIGWARRGTPERKRLAGVGALLAAAMVWWGTGELAGRFIRLRTLALEPWADTRLTAYREGARLFAASPLWGWGFGAFEHVFPLFLGERLLRWRWTHLHNDYLEILAEGGLLGAAALAAVLVSTVRTLVRGAPHVSAERRAFLRGLTIGWIAVGLHSALDFSLHRFANALLLAALAGLAVRAVTGADESERLPYATPLAWHPKRGYVGRVSLAVVLLGLVLAMLWELRGEVAFARFEQSDRLRERALPADTLGSVVRELAREAERVLDRNRANPDHQVELAVRLLRWVRNERIEPSARIRMAEQAAQAAGHAVRAAPSNYEYWLWWGRTLTVVGREGAAEVCLRRARALAPASRRTNLTL